MRPRKIQPERLLYVRTVIALRKALPTHAELARLEGVSKSLVDQIAAGICYKDPRGTITNVQAVLMALGLASPYKDSNANP
jgi:hypothetical protein